VSRRDLTRTIDIAMRTWPPRVTEAALAFEARWTQRALKFHNPKLSEQFEAQLGRYDAAMNSGNSTEIDTEGSRLCRAYGVIAADMQKANVPDDAYVIGRDRGGLTIAISAVPSARDRVRDLYGDAVIWFSPDEVATLIAMDERAQKIAAVKASFPGAEIINVNGASK